MRPPVAPYLIVTPAAAAIAYYIAVFGARQKAYLPALDILRVGHCELEINGGAVMLSDAFPELGHTRPPLPGEFSTAAVSLEFDEASKVDDIHERATQLGAKSETSPTNSFWGTRYAAFRDPFGHRWILNGPAKS
jgi:PhnB protein